MEENEQVAGVEASYNGIPSRRNINSGFRTPSMVNDFV